MKTLSNYISESVFDGGDLDYMGDLLDLYNSKSKEEYVSRWEHLVDLLKSSADLAPYDKRGLLIHNPRQLYIRLERVGEARWVDFGPAKKGYMMRWSDYYNQIEYSKNAPTNYTDMVIKAFVKESPLYLLPDSLVKSYKKLIRSLK